MKLSKPINHRSIDRPKPIDRFTFITDDCVKLAIPVGPRFQAEVPPWTLLVSRSCLTVDDSKSNEAKWIGSQIWPMKGRSQDASNKVIGRGRSETCGCAFPRSIECVKRHVSLKKIQLQIDLGPAFWRWKIDEMGEDVSKLWNLEEQKRFEYVVKLKMSTGSHGKSVIDLAMKCFPSQSKRSIVSYYLNVYIPRRISIQTRSSCVSIDTDDECDDMLCLKGGCKRLQANNFTSRSRKYVKTAYLMARR